MQIRKFVIAVVSTFDDKGNKKAVASMKETRRQAAELTKEYIKLDRAQEATAQSAKKMSSAADDADDELAKLQRQVVSLDEKIKDLNRSIAKQRKRLSELNTRSLKDVGASFDGASDKLGKFRSAMAPIGEVAAMAARGIAAFTTAGVAVGAGVITVGTQFETLRARLKTVEGSAEGAERAFARIQEFTKTTPFQLDEVTTAFVRLKSLGLDASQQSLSAFGNLAAAQGKSIIDFIEAVADASTGEFERLKEFGIKASSQGEQVAFTFKGTTTTVGKNADEIQAFLRGLGETEFAGAMEEQMATTAGAISNLKDTFFTFLDTVAQMGVLDEFKALLSDLSGLAGNEGFAGIIAEGLVMALKSLREILANVTEEDIREFLNTAIDLAKSLAGAVEFLVEAFKLFTIASGDAGSSVENLTLIVFGLVAAFTGPAGLVAAAGLVGTAMGRMLANVALDLDGTNDRIAELDARVAKLRANINASNRAAAAAESQAAARSDEIDRKREEYAKKREQRLERQAGGLGAGLVREDISEEERGFQAQFIELGGEEAQAAARSKLFTEAGQQVTAKIAQAERKKIDEVEARARREARRAGKSREQIDKAAQNARVGAARAAQASRRKAFEAAQKTFEETGSAEAAATAGAAQVAGRGKKGGLGRRGKADTFFDFEKRVERAARSQAEVFAQQELERLRAEGVAVEDAIAQSRAAGRKRAEVLTQKFLEAGKIFDPGKEDNILDILGLKGPGSVLEGRPAPEVLTINIAPIINLIGGDFNMTATFEGTEAGVREALATGGETLVQESLAPNMQQVRDLFDQMLGLLGDRLISAAGGGTQTQGPPG
jgi:hypothetical protein